MMELEQNPIEAAKVSGFPRALGRKLPHPLDVAVPSSGVVRRLACWLR